MIGAAKGSVDPVGSVCTTRVRLPQSGKNITVDVEALAGAHVTESAVVGSRLFQPAQFMRNSVPQVRKVNPSELAPTTATAWMPPRMSVITPPELAALMNCARVVTDAYDSILCPPSQGRAERRSSCRRFSSRGRLRWSWSGRILFPLSSVPGYGVGFSALAIAISVLATVLFGIEARGAFDFGQRKLTTHR